MKNFLIVIALVLAAVGCRDGVQPTGSETAQPAATSGALRTEEGVPGPLPARATSSEQVDRDVHNGEEVFITDEGFVPALLYAKQGAEIRFVNETDSAKQIEFTNLPWTSKEIEPGEFDSYTPDATVSITFELVGEESVSGRIQVTEYYEPGETAEPDSDR